MKKKVLVVEKDEDILHIITHILTNEGYLVSSSKTEKDILEKIKLIKPDVILLDIIRPTHEGTELCRAIKEYDSIKHIPVVVLSTHININLFKDVCADEVIPKPFDITELVSIIEGQIAA